MDFYIGVSVDKFKVIISNVQHITKLEYSLSLSENRVYCVVGKNSVGKTTLIKAMKNLVSSDIFSKTSSQYIFSDKSKIIYEIDYKSYTFTYDTKLNTLDTKEIIDKEVTQNIITELPIPYGDRFSHFQKLGEIDSEIRQKIIDEEYKSPDELIELFKCVYQTDKFDKLKEIRIKHQSYFVLLRDDGYYIREDYFSSGEYFILNLYRIVTQGSKLIVIDELDISLDAMAQVYLIKEFRKLCKEYHANLVFTTHSLAIMKVLDEDELFYMENNNGICTIESRSYNYIKSLLYQFDGWDRYILTEDKMLQSFLEYLLINENIFSKYKIIFIGGGSNVVDLMKRNTSEKFLSDKRNVLSVLDGDISNQSYCQGVSNLEFLPFASLEKQLKVHYDNGELDQFSIGIAKHVEKNAKNIYNRLVDKGHMSQHEIFEFLIEKNQEVVDEFKSKLLAFLDKN